LQDRLVKELRLRGIGDVDAANAFVPEFMADDNRHDGRAGAGRPRRARAVRGRLRPAARPDVDRRRGHWQALVASPLGLTNRETTAITGL
jgi:hypothetical protein